MKILGLDLKINKCNYMFTNCIKSAFTLMEVLLVLVIIAALALMLMKVVTSVQDMTLKVGFKKAYSVASQAWAQVVAENPGTYIAKGGWSCTFSDGTTGDFSANDGRTDAFKAKMKVIKSCVNQAGCWADNYEYQTNQGLLGNPPGKSPNKYAWVTSDGMFWANPWKDEDEVALLVDTNGSTPPNQIGKDIFSFLLGADGVVYFGIDDKSMIGKPVSNGLVCPESSFPKNVNGRMVNFRDWLN